MFWLLRVSVTGVRDEVDAGGRNQTGTMAAVRNLVQDLPRSSTLDLGANRKPICNFLLVISGTTVRVTLVVSPTVLRDIDAKSYYKIACLLHPNFVRRPRSGEPVRISG